MPTQRNPSDIGMRSSIRAKALFELVRILRLQRRRKIAGVFLSTISRLEGGECFSFHLRRALREWYDVHIGLFSYGPIFRPGMFPGTTHVGRYTSIGPSVRSVERNHPYTRLSTSSFFYEPSLGLVDHVELPPYQPLQIGHDVWIGLNATLLPGCRNIGNGAIVGAGAIVTKNVPPFAIVAGSPAKLIRYRFGEEQIEQIDRSEWWMKSPSQLKELKEIFTAENPFDPDLKYSLAALGQSEQSTL
jgi:virginiamycin A acetyltransferase